MEPKEKPITPQELIFLQGIVQGNTMLASFNNAFKDTNKVNWTTNSKSVECSNMIRTPRLSAKLAEMKDEYEKTIFMSLEYKRAELRGIYEDISFPIKERLNAMKLDAQLAQQLNQKIELGGGMKVEHSVDPRISEAVDKLFGN